MSGSERRMQPMDAAWPMLSGSLVAVDAVAVGGGQGVALNAFQADPVAFLAQRVAAFAPSNGCGWWFRRPQAGRPHGAV